MTTAAQKPIEISTYTDYVTYLKDLVRQKRKLGSFSYRIFCERSGFRSTAYLKWVVDGVRPIAVKSARKFAIGLSLTKTETQYFMLMVNYQAATDPETKRIYYEQMLSFKQRRAGSFTKDAYEYLSHWYYVAIRELVASPDFRDDPHWIRNRLGGRLSLKEIKSGLETLTRLKLICQDSSGRWRQTERDLLTEYEVKSLAAYNYHSEMLELAQRILTTHPVKARDYQSIVALVDAETLARVKDKVQSFQQDILDFLQEGEKKNGHHGAGEELYALNMQLLPLAAPKRGDL